MVTSEVPTFLTTFFFFYTITCGVNKQEIKKNPVFALMALGMCSSVQIHQTHCFQSMLIVRVLFMIEKQPFIFWLFIFNRTIMFKEGCIFKKIFSVVRCFSLINSKKKNKLLLFIHIFGLFYFTNYMRKFADFKSDSTPLLKKSLERFA